VERKGGERYGERFRLRAVTTVTKRSKPGSESCSRDLLSRHFRKGLLRVAHQRILRVHTLEQINRTRDQSRPSRLMAGSYPCAIVAVEVLVKQNVIPPVRVFLELLGSSIDRAPIVGVMKSSP